MAQKLPCSLTTGVQAGAEGLLQNPHATKQMSKKPQPEKPKVSKAKTVAKKPAAVKKVTPSRPAFDHLGELPHGYGVDTIFLVAQEPHWLFTYWDIDIAKHPGGAASLRYYANGTELEGEVEVPFETRNWYLPVKCSVNVTTPPEGMAASEDFDYATIPFHLSFQRLIDNLESATRAGEDPLSAVSRMQQKGDFSAFGGLGFGDLLSDDQRALLSALLGPSFTEELSSGAFSSGDIESRIRTFLEEQLSSGGASEFLSSGGASGFLSAAGASEFLSSFRDTGIFSAGAFSSKSTAASWGGAALSSWTPAAFASWAQAALTSWSQAATTSWSVGGESSGSVVTMSSWLQAALTSWSQAATSSWTVSGESSGSLVSMSSWVQGVQSSWLQGVQSSWAQAALASWTSAEVTSWFSGSSVTSWGGASDNLSSSGDSFSIQSL
jgi:hypothetical protein